MWRGGGHSGYGKMHQRYTEMDEGGQTKPNTDDKTELLLIGTKQQLQKINMFTLCLCNDLIKPSKEVKNLGVWLDPSLTMNTHINKTCSIAFYNLYNLRRIQKYLSQDSLEILIHTLIYSRIDYCNSLYLGLPDYQIQKIQ